ncbi:GNAT family N-acetyltransferase [Sphingomonas sp.]|uniref:GNAT family N-acetyltransferase n=1 Tax=Sphingomonas sp. TaxID=28214 RepID=UPI0035C7EB6A
MIELIPLDTVAPDAVERLLDRAFGTDRHGRTAYRLRKGVRAIPALSFAAMDRDVLIGSIQCWPVLFEGDGGDNAPMVLVGPVAVAPERQQGGIGRLLMEASLAAAHEWRLDDAMMLVGDPEYYARFFGFSAERTGGWRLPGPFEPRRLLARGERVPAASGEVRPAQVVPA